MSLAAWDGGVWAFVYLLNSGPPAATKSESTAPKSMAQRGGQRCESAADDALCFRQTPTTVESFSHLGTRAAVGVLLDVPGNARMCTTATVTRVVGPRLTGDPASLFV